MFYARNINGKKHYSWCKSCIQEYGKKKYSNDPIKKKEYSRLRRSLFPDRCREVVRKTNFKKRLSVLKHYSGGDIKCNCCEEKEFKFMCIDHINGGGNKHKREIGHGGSRLCDWIKKNNFPDGFQILCHNCNMAKGFYGECPHKESN